jgi:hypothetical protein
MCTKSLVKALGFQIGAFNMELTCRPARSHALAVLQIGSSVPNEAQADKCSDLILIKASPNGGKIR